MRDWQFMTDSPEATRSVGACLGNALLAAKQTEPLVINLNGELGAGKTTFVGGLLRAMGVTGAVRSPTYTLIEPYDLDACLVYHLDLYRLGDARELEMLALRDLLQPGAVLLVEWAERGATALPPPDLVLELRYPGLDGDQKTQRSLHVRAYSEGGELLLNKLVADVS